MLHVEITTLKVYIISAVCENKLGNIFPYTLKKKKMLFSLSYINQQKYYI